MKIRDMVFAVVLMAAMTSCEKELDFKYHDIAPLTVIEGELTPDGAKVGITLTTPMAEPMDCICNAGGHYGWNHLHAYTRCGGFLP